MFQPWSWALLWWWAQIGSRLSRSVRPPLRHQMMCARQLAARSMRTEQPGIAHVNTAPATPAVGHGSPTGGAPEIELARACKTTPFRPPRHTHRPRHSARPTPDPAPRTGIPQSTVGPPSGASGSTTTINSTRPGRPGPHRPDPKWNANARRCCCLSIGIARAGVGVRSGRTTLARRFRAALSLAPAQRVEAAVEPPHTLAVGPHPQCACGVAAPTAPSRRRVRSPWLPLPTACGTLPPVAADAISTSPVDPVDLPVLVVGERLGLQRDRIDTAGRQLGGIQRVGEPGQLAQRVSPLVARCGQGERAG